MCFQDKKYATDKYKDIYTELSIVKAKAERDLGRLRDQLQLAHEALGEPSLEDVERGGYGTDTHTHARRAELSADWGATITSNSHQRIGREGKDDFTGSSVVLRQ